MSSKNSRTLMGILFLIFIFFLFMAISLGFVFNKIVGGEDSDSNRGKSESSIAVIEVKGVIRESRKIIELLHRAEEEDNFKAIIMRIDSPGGSVGPTQEIYQEIRRIDEIKPIYASFGSIAASGGYYIGAGTRKIFANPGTLTGSIGVIMEFMDLSKLYELAKIKQNTLKAGRYKDLGHPGRPMKKEEKDLMNGMIEGVHGQFIKDIMRMREKKIKGDINELAQGQVFSGEDAWDWGLVDELGGLWFAGRSIHEELKLQGEFELVFIKEKKKFSFFEIVENLEEATSRLNLGALSQKIPMLLYRN